MQGKINKLVFEVQFDNESSPYNGKHFSNSYLKRFILFRQSIIANLKDYISVDVLPKQPPKYYSLVQVAGNNNLYHDVRHNKLVHFPRKGSFQVTIDNFLVFSRLQTGKWPEIQSLTEWAFKVAEKMLDLEIEKERPIIQNSKLQIYSRREEASTRHRKSQHFRDGKKKSSDRSFVQQKLPRIEQTIDKKNSIISNFTTLPVRLQSKNSNFTPQKVKERQSLPSNFNKKDFQKTQRVFRYSNNKSIKHRASQQKRIVYYSNSKSRSKNQSFHWNLGTPLDFSVNKDNKTNEDFLRETVHRNKKIELEPLRKQIALESIINPIDFLKINKQIQEQIEKIELKISQSYFNTFRGLYKIQGNFITKKTKAEKWTPILCQNVLPLKGQYYFNLAVIHSAQNMIKIGIVPLNYYPDAFQKEERRDEFFISYDCSNGMIRDSKLDEKSQTTSWRLGGESAPRYKSFQIRVMIDMDTNYIDWYVQEDIVASSKISQSFSQGFRVILNIAEANDCVLLNEQNWKGKIKGEEGKFFLKEESIKQQQGAQFKKVSQVILQKKELCNERELIIEQGIQATFVGTIKKQRVTKFTQRKRNVSVLRDQSAFEHQLLQEQNNRRLEQNLNFYDEAQDKQPIMQRNQINADKQKQISPEKQRKHEPQQTKIELSKKTVKVQPQATAQIQAKPINLQAKRQPQNATPPSTYTAQKIEQKTQKVQPTHTVIAETIHKEQQKIQQQPINSVFNSQSESEVPKQPISNKISQPEQLVAQNQISGSSLQSKRQIVEKKEDQIKEEVDKEQKIEWIACYQDNRFKVEQKAREG